MLYIVRNVTFVFELICFVESYYMCICIFVEKKSCKIL